MAVRRRLHDLHHQIPTRVTGTIHPIQWMEGRKLVFHSGVQMKQCLIPVDEDSERRRSLLPLLIAKSQQDHRTEGF